jgi:hypothetical protein
MATPRSTAGAVGNSTTSADANHAERHQERRAFGNTAANTFEGAYEAIKAIWGMLPAATAIWRFRRSTAR